MRTKDDLFRLNLVIGIAVPLSSLAELLITKIDMNDCSDKNMDNFLYFTVKKYKESYDALLIGGRDDIEIFLIRKVSSLNI